MTAIDYDVPVEMPDGVVLATDVYRPGASGRYPAILVRTPYGKLGVAAGMDPLESIRAGYALVVQDVRGTTGSDGRFRPFMGEAEDGAASVAWAASQEWSNGSVFMANGSYMGATQLYAASRAPSALKAIAPIFAPAHGHGGWAYQGGAFQLGSALSWSVGLALGDLFRRDGLGEDPGPGRELLEAVAADPWSAFNALPLVELPRRVPLLEAYGEWLAHPDRDDYWQASAISELYETIDVPALHTAGWYDIFLKGTLENYVGLRNRAATEHARANQRLVVTPWAHTNPNEIIGELWFGPEAGLPLFANLRLWQRTFFETFLSGGRPLESPPVRIFVMGANRWRDEDEWPLRRAVDDRLYLRAGGRLTREAPAEEAPDEFLYDPADPVQTVGGNTLFPFPTAAGGLYAGARDHRGIRSRPDVLCYTSEVLREDLEVTGPLEATLHVATSARDTDFTLALVDVYPDGRAIGIADGILRLRYRDGLATQRLATPGDAYEIGIDLVATSNLFKAGNRIGVEVSSSNVPRFDRNPNYGGVVAEAVESDFVVARQHVFHDANRASYITLPVVR